MLIFHSQQYQKQRRIARQNAAKAAGNVVLPSPSTTPAGTPNSRNSGLAKRKRSNMSNGGAEDEEEEFPTPTPSKRGRPKKSATATPALAEEKVKGEDDFELLHDQPALLFKVERKGVEFVDLENE
jgi:hypothetical protein